MLSPGTVIAQLDARELALGLRVAQRLFDPGVEQVVEPLMAVHTQLGLDCERHTRAARWRGLRMKRLDRRRREDSIHRCQELLPARALAHAGIRQAAKGVRFMPNLLGSPDVHVVVQ